MSFPLFDPDQGVRVTAGNLPHWFQPGVTYFVTFRTADSVPAPLADRWHRERKEWLDRHGVRPDLPGWEDRLERLPPPLRREYYHTFPERFLGYLDQGLGGCPLRHPAAARVVADALTYFDGTRYDLGDFVVMPNHVHLLVCLRGDTDVVRQTYSWKKYAAGELNKLLGLRGRFWQEESFDHLVRSPEQFERLRCYIADNPARAKLRSGEYLLCRRGEERHTECAYYTEDRV